MATPTKTATDQRIEIGLESLRLMLGDLPEVAEEWPHLGDAERASWSLDWDQLMGSYLTLLERYDRAGELTAAQRRRYREVLHTLEEALPLIARLNLYPPPVLPHGANPAL